MFFRYENGELKEFLVGEGNLRKRNLGLRGLRHLAQISQGKLGSQLALMSGKLKLKGNMVKALKLASIADRLNKVLAKVDAEY